MNSEFPCMTDKIRAVADRSSHLTNKQIKDAVFNRFQVEPTASQIVNAVGSHEKRLKRNPEHIRHLETVARDYVRKIGDRQLARELVGSVTL